MIETPRLILDKGREKDWKSMFRNVWSRPESARYMSWQVTESEDQARDRMRRTIAFQKEHDTYLVYEKESGQAIGFAGVERVSPTVYEEAGICLGPDYIRKGYGTEIVQGLIEYTRKTFGALEFQYSSRDNNEASIRLAESLGFVNTGSRACLDEKNGTLSTILIFRKKLVPYVRKALLSDAEAICRISSEEMGYPCDAGLVREKLKNLDPAREAVFVAMAGDASAGYIHVEKYDVLYFPSMANILGLAVSAASQHLGMGKALLAAAEDWARQQGIRQMRLNSGIDRTGAHAFYRHLGYIDQKKQLRFIKQLDVPEENHE